MSNIPSPAIHTGLRKSRWVATIICTLAFSGAINVSPASLRAFVVLNGNVINVFIPVRATLFTRLTGTGHDTFLHNVYRMTFRNATECDNMFLEGAATHELLEIDLTI